jgi:MFS family permease
LVWSILQLGYTPGCSSDFAKASQMTGVHSHAIASDAASSAERTRRHIAVRLLPFVFLLYITNYLDRTSVAYAAIGMARDLGFDDRVFGLGIGIFFLSYVALQIPGAMLAQRWSARGMICATMIVSGLLTALTAVVHTPAQLYLARFLLGAAEAGFFPSVIVYLGHWFIQEDRAKATGNFMAAIPVSLIIGSPVAGWILSHNWFAIDGWRWLFFLEGIPAILLGIVAFCFLTDRPSQARWLTVDRRQSISQKLEQEKPLSRQSISIGQALRSRTVVLLTTAAFLQYFIGYSVIFWLPTILNALQWMAFRQKSRKTLARCGPTLDRRNRIAVPHQSAQLECNVGFTVERHLHGHGISAGVLGDSNGNPQRLQGGSCRGNDQRACQPGRFCRTVRVRISPR